MLTFCVSSIQVETKFPPNDDCIGYLTTASFSFNEGCGSGLGACTVTGIRRLQAMDQRYWWWYTRMSQQR